MAKKIEEDKMYLVDLKKPLAVGRRKTILPGSRVELRGDLLKAAVALDPESVGEYSLFEVGGAS